MSLWNISRGEEEEEEKEEEEKEEEYYDYSGTKDPEAVDGTHGSTKSSTEHGKTKISVMPTRNANIDDSEVEEEEKKEKEKEEE